MLQASVAVRLTARGLVDAFQMLKSSRDVFSPGPELPTTLRRAMALVSAVAMREGYPFDIASQINAFTVMTGRPVKTWGPASFTECDERDAILLDTGYGVPTAECFDLAELRTEDDIREDLFHERLRSALRGLPAKHAASLYREVRQDIVRRPVRTRSEVLSFAQSNPELAGEIPGFFKQLPASATDGHILRLCGHCQAPLFPSSDRRAFPMGRCAVRECRMAYPDPVMGSEHDVASPSDWRIADPAIMTFWVGPGLPEIKLYDELRAIRDDVELYPVMDMADVGIGGLAVGVDIKSYSSAAVLGERFSRDIGGLRAFKRRIVAVPDFWISIDRDYLKTAARVSSLKDGIEFLSVGQVVREFTR
ncbi:hypothetical protein [Rhizobium leguminosarum]|uniref:REase associating with pPIWI RE domain-containing protein n=1 Tax=Rhizobium leguminosarum TaxID=384 RepID=A0A7M3DWB1_RHILE|nr:hypothetical protein [Rhizobium leguminosarum]TAY52974.1 hypothetical protein ELH90_15735 [Rhizobium leguminosarum]